MAAQDGKIDWQALRREKGADRELSLLASKDLGDIGKRFLGGGAPSVSKKKLYKRLGLHIAKEMAKESRPLVHLALGYVGWKAVSSIEDLD